MHQFRPIVLTLAGFDPTAGAGILADIKTIEANKGYGIAVQTANTIQTTTQFNCLKWEEPVFVIQQLQTILTSFDVAVIKIGIVPNASSLIDYLMCIKANAPKAKIIWDPILKSSTEFTFLSSIDELSIQHIARHIDLITPNYNEIQILVPDFEDTIDKASHLSKYCDVLLKGGHNSSEHAVDYYVTNQEIKRLVPRQIVPFEKHGSGCVLSSAIATQLAYKYSMEEAIKKGKEYIEYFLHSNQTLLGYHDSSNTIY